MRCAEFERALVDLVDAGRGAPGPRVAALRAHAEGCDACRGALDLVAVLVAPDAEAEGALAPPPGYWESFDRRVRARIGRSERPVGRARARWLVPAAAALAAAALGYGWLRPGPTAEPGESDAAARQTVADSVPAPLDAGFGLGLGLADDEGGWIGPAVDGLDALDEDAQRALLDWLQTENAKAGGVSG